jgi:hypothetical protein
MPTYADVCSLDCRVSSRRGERERERERGAEAALEAAEPQPLSLETAASGGQQQLAEESQVHESR